MASVNLGSIKFTWKGAYNAGTAYAVDDVVSHSGGSYICILASTGNVPTNTTYWNVMSQAGTDGTDVSTTLTTQGDILYRDGSGLQRLPKGTANQVLKMNSGATAPEYGTLSSDYVKLVETTAGGSESVISIDGYFSSTYKVYKAFVSNLCFNGDPTGFVNFRMNVGGSEATSSYYVSTGGVYGGTNSTYYKQTLWNTSSLQHGGWNGPTVNTTGTASNWSAEYTFYDPSNTSYHKNVTAQFGGWERGGTYTYTGNSFVTHYSSNALTGFTMQNNYGGTFRAGTKFSLYGLK